MKDIFFSLKTLNKWGRFSLHMILMLFTFTVIFTSCEDKEIEPVVSERVPELSASNTDIILNQKQSNSTAVVFNWTAGSNYGTNSGIEYALEFSTQQDFSNALVIELGKGIYSASYRGIDLNNLAINELGLPTGTDNEIFVRVKSTPLGGSFEPVYSNVEVLSVTPYQEVSSTLYMIGDATPNGWNAGSPTEMHADPNDPTTFTTTVQLTPGEFKFIVNKGEFLPSYNKGADENSLFYRTEDAQPDDKFTVVQAGLYKVTVNLVDLTISRELQEGPPYTQLYAVGSATPKGWDLDNADMMIQSDADPFIFTYSAVLNAGGEFKIATAKDWGAEFYRPTVADAPVTHSEVQLSAGDPDNKWKISDAGFYKVTLNVREMTISFDQVNLYLIGDAGPNGWNIGSPEPMTKNGAVYTYTGPLTPGELKISKFTGDWCDGEWINAASPDQEITNGTYITTQGCNGPDNKWRVTDATAGDYTISIDLSSGEMIITPQ